MLICSGDSQFNGLLRWKLVVEFSLVSPLLKEVTDLTYNGSLWMLLWTNAL